MCDNPYCPEHPGEVVEWDGGPEARVEVLCACNHVVGEVTVEPIGWWSAAHPSNQTGLICGICEDPVDYPGVENVANPGRSFYVLCDRCLKEIEKWEVDQ